MVQSGPRQPRSGRSSVGRVGILPAHGLRTRLGLPEALDAVECQEVRIVEVPCPSQAVVMRRAAHCQDVGAEDEPVPVLVAVELYLGMLNEDSAHGPVEEVG